MSVAGVITTCKIVLTSMELEDESDSEDEG
jgi:hypothetical protein